MLTGRVAGEMELRVLVRAASRAGVVVWESGDKSICPLSSGKTDLWLEHGHDVTGAQI
jgi:hypothetical protein